VKGLINKDFKKYSLYCNCFKITEYNELDYAGDLQLGHNKV